MCSSLFGEEKREEEEEYIEVHLDDVSQRTLLKKKVEKKKNRRGETSWRERGLIDSHPRERLGKRQEMCEKNSCDTFNGISSFFFSLKKLVTAPPVINARDVAIPVVILTFCFYLFYFRENARGARFQYEKNKPQVPSSKFRERSRPPVPPPPPRPPQGLDFGGRAFLFQLPFPTLQNFFFLTCSREG